MKLHSEGKRIIIISIILSLALAAIGVWLLPKIFLYLYLTALLLALFLILRFFRIPKREFIISEDHVLAPADGKVVAIERVTETEYFNQERIQVSIFMSIYNVHINWYPVSGVIKYFKYHPGKYLVARHPKSSDLNERTTIVIGNRKYEVMTRQIAGYVARRITCNAVSGNTVKQSTEMGFIKFGSRLDLFLPVDCKISIQPGQKTVGGVTPIAELK